MTHTYLKTESGMPALKHDSSEYLHLREVYRLQRKFNPALCFKLTPHDRLLIKKAQANNVFGKHVPKYDVNGLPIKK